MKPNTIKYMHRVRETWEGSAVDGPMIRASCDAIESLARRLSKLERAGKVTPERKQVQEEFPRMDTSIYYSSNMSVDVLLTLTDMNGRAFNVVGYYTYRQKKWMMYDEDGNGIEMCEPVKSWRYITDPATTPPTVAPSAWVSVKDRLPEIGKLYRNLSNNVLVYVEGHENAERVCIGFYNYSRRAWEVVGRSDIHTVVIKWQPLPDAPHD